MKPREMVPLAFAARVDGNLEPVEATVDQGANVASRSSAFDVGAFSWSSPDGKPRAVRLTFPLPFSKGGAAAVTLPRSVSGLTGTPGFPAAIIEFTGGGSIRSSAIVDWPLNGRSVVFVASQVTLTLRTQNPNTVTPAAQLLFPVQLSEAGFVVPRDFAPMTYTETAENTVPASGTLGLWCPQFATALMLNAQASGVPFIIQALDELGDPTLTARTAAPAAGTERPERPTPIPAGAIALLVSNTSLTPFAVRPVWLVDLA